MKRILFIFMLSLFIFTSCKNTKDKKTISTNIESKESISELITESSYESKKDKTSDSSSELVSSETKESKEELSISSTESLESEEESSSLSNKESKSEKVYNDTISWGDFH